MEALKLYISLIEPRLLRHVKGKPGQFIALLREEIFFDETVFKQRICGTDFSPSYYRTLKSRTLKILQALVIISSSQGNSEVKKNYDNCQKYFLLGQKMLTQGKNSEGIRLIRQAHRIAVEYNFVHLASELSSLLHHDHSYYHVDERKARFYAKQMLAYANDYIAEKKAEEIFYQAVRQLTRSKDVELAEDLVQEMESCTISSIKTQYYKTTLNLIYGFQINDYEHVIKNCDQALLFFADKKGTYGSHYQIFLSRRGIAEMAIGKYHKAQESLEEANKFAPSKSYNDYVVKFYQTLNALHSGDYLKAYSLFKQNKRCRFEVIRRQFAIIEAYLYFLAHNGQFHLEKRFRLGKYLNETFESQSDKQGDNINILIAELLVYLVQNRGKFIDRIEAVKHYSYRHLQGRDTRRAKAFLKILCTLPRANFHPKALERLAKKQLEYLETHPIHLGDNFAVEIIPFGDLLQLIIGQLQRKVA